MKSDSLKMPMVLRANVREYFFPDLVDKYVVHPVLRNGVTGENISVRVFERCGVSAGVFYDDWKHFVKQHKSIIIFDTGWRKGLTKYIKRKNEECKIHLFFFNKIHSHLHSLMLSDPYADYLWSFDPGDVQKYGLKYNSTFFINGFSSSIEQIKWDIIFLGRDKNRRSIIEDILLVCKGKGLVTNFKIVNDEKDFVDYHDYIKMVNQSKAILDITSESQHGLTLRFMEALFLRKKIITNNSEVRSYDFYSKNNVFILGEDSLSFLSQFLQSPYFPIDERIIESYSFSNWMLRFVDYQETDNSSRTRNMVEL